MTYNIPPNRANFKSTFYAEVAILTDDLPQPDKVELSFHDETIGIKMCFDEVAISRVMTWSAYEKAPGVVGYYVDDMRKRAVAAWHEGEADT